MKCNACEATFEDKDRRRRYCNAHRLSPGETRNRAQRERWKARLGRLCECGARLSRSDKSARCTGCKLLVRRRQRREYERDRRNMLRVPCSRCGRPKRPESEFCRSCARKELFKDPANVPGWKGGRIQSKAGYIQVRTNSLDKRHPYELEHRLVWAQAHGPIPKGHHVHHLNGVKTDNRLENLVAMSKSEHHRNHHEPWEARIRALEALVAHRPP